MPSSANDSIAKNFLLISYYWPPSGGVGVQRWLQLTKYLPEWGWNPVVLTPENPAFGLRDPNLEREVPAHTEVIRLPIWEPYHLVTRFGGKNVANINYGVALEGEHNKPSSKIMQWLRGNVVLPDPRVFWVRPASRFALDIIERNEIKAIITTGPPHSMHLIGLNLKKKTGLPWIADFRDPWSEWDVLRRMYTGKLAMKLHKSLEKKVLQRADLVVAATPGLAESLVKIGNRPVETLLNGLDVKAIPRGRLAAASPDKFRLFHAGMLNEGRNPKHLWPVLAKLCREDAAFAEALEVELVGSVSPSITPAESFPELQDKILVKPPVPNAEVYAKMQQAAVLLLLVDWVPSGHMYIPYKTYEYLAAQKPVLYIGFPDNAAGNILAQQHAGESFFFTDEAGIEDYLKRLFKEYQRGSAMVRKTDLSPFDRKQQALQLSRWMNGL